MTVRSATIYLGRIVGCTSDHCIIFLAVNGTHISHILCEILLYLSQSYM